MTLSDPVHGDPVHGDPVESYPVQPTGPAALAQPDAGPWTVPNALSALRLLGVPLFLWLLLGQHADLAAILVLVASSFTDWLDGVLARKLGQLSAIGAFLDPLADRLYILATLVGLVLRQVIPWWLAAIIVGRDLLLVVGTGPGLRRRGYIALPVHYLGKAATFALLYAFPLLLIGTYRGTVADIARPIAWAFTIWGTVLYVWAGVIYVFQYREIVRRQPR